MTESGRRGNGSRPRRLRVLMSAYACEPGKGSEPGVGWNVAREMARHHDVWVLTRANNRPAIEAELAKNPVPGVHFIWHDLPRWARWWKRGGRGVQLYYYLWQLSAIRAVRRAHAEVGFDIAHHVTFVKYWAPTCLAFLPVPFVWGPVGGGESAPWNFWPGLGLRGIVHEGARDLMRFLSEYDPLVRKSARRAALSIATTEQTASRLRRMGVTKLEVLPAVAIDPSEIPLPGESSTGDRAGTVRFVSSGNLIDLKGLHLSVRAFAEAGLEQALYWIVGEGPARQKLEGLCRQLDVAGRIRFLGWLPRGEALCKLADCDALLVPSLHDSGSFVCLEAMAAGKPVICLDLGGPSLLVGEDCGVKVPAVKVNHAVRDLAAAMRRVAEDRAVALAMGEAGRRRVLEKFTWSSKIGTMASWYEKLLSEERAGLG